MTYKTFKKKYKYQKGGWYENTFNNFKDKAILENDKLKQTSEWWDELKGELDFYANEMSDEFMEESRFQNMPMGAVLDELDLLNLLIIDIALTYSRILTNDYGQMPKQKLIEFLNKRTINLKKINNIDFVEFIQILLLYVKSTKYYSEINVLEYTNDSRLEEDYTTTLGVSRLARKIINGSSRWGNYYKLYKNLLIDCVKLLEVFLYKAYTGEYEELQSRAILCKDYFFDSIENREKIIDEIMKLDLYEKDYNSLIVDYDKLYDEYDKYSDSVKTGLSEEDPTMIKLRDYQKQLDDMMQLKDKLEKSYKQYKLKLFELAEIDVTQYNEFIDKEEIKRLWNQILKDFRIPKVNDLGQSDRFDWKLILKKRKQTFGILLISMLKNRNNYTFFVEGKIDKGDFNKDIYKTYEQFQVKLAVFYKKILNHWLGFDTIDEYYKANEDIHKYKNDLDFRFIDIVNCIEEEFNIISNFIHPKNKEYESDDSDEEDGSDKEDDSDEEDDSDKEDDSDEDSDDEFERIGNKYINRIIKTESDEEDEYEVSIFPSTRFRHLYDLSLGIDEDEDSDDEFERIGNEYINHVIKTDPEKWDHKDWEDAYYSLVQLEKLHNPDYIPKLYVNNLGKLCSVKINGIEQLNCLILDIKEKPKIITNDPLEIPIDDQHISKDYVYIICIGFNRLNLVEVNVEDVYSIRWNGYNYLVDDTIYFINYKGKSKIKAYLLEAKIIHLYTEEDVDGEDILTHILVNINDTNQNVHLDIKDKRNSLNINKLGAILSAQEYVLNGEIQFNEKKDELWKTFIDFRSKNEIGEPTYHLEYSKNKRGNPKIRHMLKDRGLGESYLEDSIEKMIAYNPDKKFNIKELRNLKGTGLDIKKHERNLFPERIAYLETIMENDKEFESESRPLEKWEQRPFGWPEDDVLAEEDFDEENRERDIELLNKKNRLGTTRKLQGEWYRQHGFDDKKNKERIPINLLEDNPIFQNEDVRNKIRKTLKKKYDFRGKSNLPGFRIGQQLRNRNYTFQRGREVANRLDRIVENRSRHNEFLAQELGDELLRQSMLIDGRTPVQVMNLEEVLRPRLNSSFAIGDNLRRRIDRQRENRESDMRIQRSAFNRENTIAQLD